jgi:hypothetical protein
MTDTELELELEQAATAMELGGIAPEALLPEGETGLGAATALGQLVGLLSQSGGLATTQDQQLALALALKQADATGRPIRRALNKPDISYVTPAGPRGAFERVNIEIEANKPFQHLNQVRRDPKARNYFVKVHPWTGQIEQAWMMAPGQKGRPTPLTPTQLQDLQRTLPKPVRDPSLSIDAKGRQRRQLLAKQRRARSARAIRPVRARQREAELEQELEFAAESLESL